MGQWSVCSAMLTGYFFATSAAYAAKATEPVTMSLIVGPERYSAPPVETWMIPSLPASAKPASAAFSVWEEDTLMAGNANDLRLRGVEHLGVLLGGGDRHAVS